MLFSVSLAEKLAKKGLISVSLHPGAIMETNLANPLVEEGFQTLGKKHVPF
jgi:NAD(P)-dependent dehydrogenase (short-subunit alcohol dehydrogenase family)